MQNPICDDRGLLMLCGITHVKGKITAISYLWSIKPPLSFLLKGNKQDQIYFFWYNPLFGIVGCLSVPSVIFWTKVPNLQGLVERVCQAIFSMAPRYLFTLLCFVHCFQNGRYLPGLEPCLTHRATLPPVEI